MSIFNSLYEFTMAIFTLGIISNVAIFTLVIIAYIAKKLFEVF